MKKILVRMGLIAATVATATLGVGSATAHHSNTHDAPQATKQWCC
jgi:hypothetical protein